jgi:hypothetical protein
MGLTSVLAGQDETAATANLLPPAASILATGTVSNSNAETIIGTFTIPAGDASSASGGYWFYVHGTSTEAANPNLTLRTRLNSTAGTILSSLGPSALTATPGTFDILLWLLFEGIGAAGTFGCVSQTTMTNVAFITGGAEAVAINTTIANTLVITAQFSAAAAANTATTKAGVLYRL